MTCAPGCSPCSPSGSDLTTLEGNRSEGNAWWVGITGEMTTFSPFRLAGDFNYGSVDMGTVRSLSGYDGATSKTIDLEAQRLAGFRHRGIQA